MLGLPAMSVVLIIVKATVFLVGARVIGRWFAPRVYRIAAKLKASDLLLATSLAICFLLAYLAARIELAATRQRHLANAEDVARAVVGDDPAFGDAGGFDVVAVFRDRVEAAHGGPDAGVEDGEDIGAVQHEHEVHFGGPDADAVEGS